MKTAVYDGYRKEADFLNQNVQSMRFYKIDNDYCVGEDGSVYQIVDIDDLFNVEYEDEDEDTITNVGDFKGDFSPILIFVDEENKVALNYAEDGTISEYVASILNDSSIFQDMDENGEYFDNGLFEVYQDNYDDESLVAIFKNINEDKEDADMENEFIYLLDDSLRNLKKI